MKRQAHHPALIAQDIEVIAPHLERVPGRQHVIDKERVVVKPA